MLDFHHSWPYERVADDLYFEECPFCHRSPVLLSLKKDAVEGALQGIKTLIVMPCCHEKIEVVQMDRDYVWATRKLR